MTNIKIAQMLRKMAAAYTILGENKFKIIAYENAATAVEHSTSELKDLWDDGKLDSVPGLGKSLISHLDEIFRTGHSKHIDETLKKIDPRVFDLLDVPGVGPKLVELKDIKGDLHMHSNFDLETSHDSGDNSIEEMCIQAGKFGYEYIAITNHNPSSKSEIITKIKEQKKYIEQLNYSANGVRVLNLLEVDIHPNGSLAVPEESLAQLDACLVSIHSSFEITKDKMTDRVLAGLSHPKAKILGHPTGRLLNKREGYELDWEQIFRFCLDKNKALEINCSPDRLDLPDILVREAVKRGVLLSLGTDAHCVEDLSLMKYGVSVARRGWAENKNIINTWDYNRLIEWLKI